jgi:hypothetical protein
MAILTFSVPAFDRDVQDVDARACKPTAIDVYLLNRENVHPYVRIAGVENLPKLVYGEHVQSDMPLFQFALGKHRRCATIRFPALHEIEDFDDIARSNPYPETINGLTIAVPIGWISLGPIRSRLNGLLPEKTWWPTWRYRCALNE